MMRFVGRDRIEAVDALASAFRVVAESGMPRLFSLEAPQGWGKTRIVQELYERLAAEQPEPRYWPPSLVGPDSVQPVPRKVVALERVPLAEGAAVPWMWWGIQCDTRQTGTRAQVLTEDLEQLEQHAAPLIAGRDHRRVLAGDALELGEHAVGTLLPPVESAVSAVRFSKAAYDAGRHALDAVQDVRAIARRATVEAVDSARAPRVARAVEILRVLGQAGRATVIVVDDAHLAGPSILGLLDRVVLGELRAPVLCVLTLWPDRVSAQRRDREEGSLGVWLETAESVRPERVVRRRLEPLPAGNLAELVRERAPSTGAEVIDALARRADGNPLVLELMLRLPAVVDATRGGRIDLAPEHVASLPADEEGILNARWNGLPSDVRTTLCLCSLQGREAVEDLLLRTYDVVRPEARERAHSSVDEAVEPYEWLRKLAERLLEFREEINLAVAAERARGLLLEHQIAEARAAIADGIVALRGDREAWSAALPQVRRALAAIHVAIARIGYPGDPAAAAASAADLASFDLDGGSYRSALALAGEAVRWHGDRADPGARARYRLLEGRARGRLADLAGARESLEAVVALSDTTGAVDASVALTARHELAALLLQSGEWMAARDQLRRVVDDATASLGPEDDTTLDARCALAEAFTVAGELKEGHRLLEELLVDRVRWFGEDHVDAVYVRVLLAALDMESDDQRRATALREALAHAERALGADHPHAIVARGALGEALQSLGRLREARELAERNLDHSERILGLNHPSTLDARGQLARVLATSGDPAARDLQERALQELDRVLGGDHPATLTARVELAQLVSALGDRTRARLALENALADHERVLGASSVYTGLARVALAGILLEEAAQLRETGRRADAHGLLERTRDLLEAVVADFERGLGRHNPRTIALRGVLGFTIDDLGDREAAAALLRGEVERASEERGVDDPATLAARETEVTSVARRSEGVRARELLEALLADRERAQGTTHAETLATRASLADLVAALDGPGGAHDLRLRVLAECDRALGAEHKQTLAALTAAGESCALVGDVAGARDAFARFARTASAVLGPDHLETLAARRREAELAARSGDRARALLDALKSDYERLVDRSERELGAQHQHTMRMRAELAATLDALGLADRANAAAPIAGGALAMPVPEGWAFKEKLVISALDGSANVLASSRPRDIATLEEHARGERDALRAEFERFEELGFGRARVFGRDGYLLRFRWDPGDGVVEQTQGYAHAAGRELTATATARAHAFDRLRAELDPTLLDLRVETPRALRALLRRLLRRRDDGLARSILRARLRAGWVASETLATSSNDGEIGVTAKVEPVDPGLDAAAFADSQAALMDEGLRFCTQLERLPATVLGDRAGEIRFFAYLGGGGEPEVAMQALWAERGRGCTVSGSCTVAAIERAGEAMSRVVAGTRLAGAREGPEVALPGHVLPEVAKRAEEWLMELPERIAEECFQKVRAYVEAIYEDRARPIPDARGFDVVLGGSTFVSIHAIAVGGPHSAVVVRSPVVFDVEPSEDLMRFLLEANRGLLFGAFGLSDDGTVLLQHVILGDTLDLGELRASVELVHQQADEYDDLIAERFGGRKTFAEPAG